MDSTLEGLILHAQAFREATSHAIEIAATEPVPGGRYKLPAFPPNYVTLTQKLADDAKSKDITPWEGRDDEYCYACSEGGVMFCCSFCPSVLCKNCYNSYDLPVPDDFVCDSCLVDISPLSD